MSDCDLTPIPSCTVDPCVIGEPAPVASVCPSSNLEDPQARTLALEQRTRRLTADIRELQRLYNLLLNNTSAGSTTLQGQITALEASMAATEAATTQNAVDITANAASIAANTGSIGTNATNIATNVADILTNGVAITANANDIAAIETNLLDNSVGEAYVSVAAASNAITSTVYLNVLANATLADKAVGNDFTLDLVNRRLVYTGAATKNFLAIACLSFVSSASNEVARFRLAENGTSDPATEISRKIGTGTDQGALAVQGVFELATNDYIELHGTLDVSAADTLTCGTANIVIHDIQPGI